MRASTRHHWTLIHWMCGLKGIWWNFQIVPSPSNIWTTTFIEGRLIGYHWMHHSPTIASFFAILACLSSSSWILGSSPRSNWLWIHFGKYIWLVFSTIVPIFFLPPTIYNSNIPKLYTSDLCDTFPKLLDKTSSAI